MEIIALKTNENKENEGIWTDLPGLDGEFLIARAQNKQFRKEAQKLIASNAKAIRRGMKKEIDVITDNMPDLIAKTILLDWKNVKENNKNVKYSYEKAIQYLNIDQFMELVLEEANDFANFRLADAEEDVDVVKNS